jgi:nucleotide-binding universal stress UspA family protein
MTGLHTKKTVIPVDFSDESIAAIDTALEIASDATEVHVVHVLPEISPSEIGVAWSAVDNETRIRHATQALRERLDSPKYDRLEFQVEVGDPGHRVAGYAADIRCDLIVVPSHGRRGVSRMLIGSVAERIVRLAHCPVLVLRK